MTEIRAGLADGLRLKMWLGLATGVAALAALSATASAQYYPPPPGAYHGYYGNAPPLPPEDMDATDEPPVAAQPAYPPPYEERRYSPYPPVAATPEPQVYTRVPPALAGPAEAPPDARPPADVGGAGGVASLPAGQAPPGALPPEYQAEQGQTKQLPPILRRQAVFYPTKEPAGTIIIDTPNTYLYLVLGKDQAMRYGIGVGREGFTWSGHERITRMAEWPDWTPPKEMIERQPYLPRFMAGGPDQSARRTRAVSRKHSLSHPRHQPALDHRHVRLVRLHPAGQRRHRWIFTSASRSEPGSSCCPARRRVPRLRARRRWHADLAPGYQCRRFEGARFRTSKSRALVARGRKDACSDRRRLRPDRCDP